MCLGGGPKAPPAPPRMKPAPVLKSPTPPPSIPTSDRFDDEESEKMKISTRKKKALEIKKTKEGVKQLGAIDPNLMGTGALPGAGTGGINNPTGGQ
tara:strand:- start:471 stop:758 length:288 start_codon:yes stop_codon:yes gene_type:complete